MTVILLINHTHKASSSQAFGAPRRLKSCQSGSPLPGTNEVIYMVHGAQDDCMIVSSPLKNRVLKFYTTQNVKSFLVLSFQSETIIDSVHVLEATDTIS